MSITIKGQPGQRLEVTGDITAILRVPFDEVEERFYLAVSDGTLIEGLLVAEDDWYDFRVAIEGAGLASIGRGELTLDSRIEWLTISTFGSGLLNEPDGG